MNTKKRIFLITTLLYVVYVIFPLFSDLINIPVWMPSIASFVVIFLLYPQAFANNKFYWFLVYAFVLFLYVFSGRPLTIGIGTVEDTKKILIELSYILPSIGIFSILNYINDANLNRILIKSSMVFLFVSFIFEVPLIIRYESVRSAYTIGENESINIIGLPSYSLMHAYTLFLPVFCYGVRLFKGRKKWLYFAGLAILSFVIYNTFVTTSLFIMVFVFFMALLYKDNVTMTWIIVGISFLIIFLLYKLGFFVTLIDWISPAFEGTQVAPKLEDFRNSMVTGNVGGENIVGRQNLHSTSWNSFCQNPLIGTSIVGGHSALLDRLGGMGIIATLPFIMIFVSIIKTLIGRFTTKTSRFFFWIGIVASFVFLYEKAVWDKEQWLIFTILMPYSLLVIENDEKQSKIS